MREKPTRGNWDAAAAKEVRGKDLTWHAPEGFAIQPLYTADDTADLDPGLPAGVPGDQLIVAVEVDASQGGRHQHRQARGA